MTLQPGAVAAMATAAAVPASRPPPPRPVGWSVRRVAGLVGESLGVIGIAFCFPLVILAIGLPIALIIRLLLWMAGLL